MPSSLSRWLRREAEAGGPSPNRAQPQHEKNFVSFKRGAVLHPECEWLWPEIAKLSGRMFLRAGGNLSSPVLCREVHKGSGRLVLKEVFLSTFPSFLVKRGQPLLSLPHSICSLIAFSGFRRHHLRNSFSKQITNRHILAQGLNVELVTRDFLGLG